MATIPLPALGIHVPQQESPLDTYSKFAQLKSLQNQQQIQQQQITAGGQENQMRAQQLRDQQAMTQAMQEWDGRDSSTLIPLVIKHGASAQSVFALRQQALNQQKTLSEMAKNDAETGSKNIETLQHRYDMTNGALNTVLQAPDEQFGQSLMSTAQQLAENKIIDPQHLQIAQQIAQMPPAQGRQALALMQKSLMSETQQLAKAKDEAGLAASAAQLPGQVAESKIKTAEADSMANGQPVNKQFAEAKYRGILQNLQAGKNVTPQEIDYAKSFEASERKTTTTSDSLGVTSSNTSGPAGLASVRRGGAAGADGTGGASAANPQSTASSIVDMVGQYKLNPMMLSRMIVKHPDVIAQVQQKYPDWDQTNYNAKNKAVIDFTSGPDAQALNSINRARAHMEVFLQTASDLDNGNVQAFNKLGNAINTQFGGNQTTNFQIAKQAFSSEVGKAFAGANVGEGDRNQVGAAIQNSNSFSQLAGAAKTADALLAGAQKVLQQKYQLAIQGKPNFGNGGGNAAVQHAPGKPAGLAEGQTGTGSDGKKYIVKGGVWVPQQ